MLSLTICTAHKNSSVEKETKYLMWLMVLDTKNRHPEKQSDCLSKL